MQETQETWVKSLSQKDPPEKEMATHSSILAWEILWTEESVRATVYGVAKSWTQQRMHARASVPRLQILLRRGEKTSKLTLHLMGPTSLPPWSPMNSCAPGPHFLLA